jgi:hypothetical protein
MASVDRRESSHGTLWRVRWREGKQQRSKHFDDEANARLWAKRLDDLGPALALRLLDEQPDPHAPTVADAVERYIRTRTGSLTAPAPTTPTSLSAASAAPPSGAPR